MSDEMASARTRETGDGTRARTVHRLGPQRNPEIDGAVLDATRTLLVERGYGGTSIDAIATVAGVGRPTIYRRWRTKAHIVHDAIYPSIEPADMGQADLPSRIGLLVSGAYALFGQPAARAGVPGLMAATRSDQELRQRLVTEQLDPVRAALRHMLDEGIATGEVRADVDVDTLLDAIAGAAIFALGVRDEADAAERAAAMTTLLLRGITAR
ncbi:TetR/AcrR family transcriptional regulator [Dietzia sp. NPDC055343]